MPAKKLGFTDLQVLNLVRDHPGSNIYQLVGHARKEMPRFDWSPGKIQYAVQRLKKDRKIKGRVKLTGARACQQLYLI